jgi:hypothetical protein
MSDNTVPISELGIGNDEVIEELEQHAEKLERFFSIRKAELNNDVLSGVAHIKIFLQDGRERLAKGAQNYIIAEGLCMFEPRIGENGSLGLCVTTRDVYETWGEMEAPTPEN